MLILRTLFVLFLFSCSFSKNLNEKHTKDNRKTIILFNGNDLDQWEGDKKLWHIENNILVAGDTAIEQPENDFIATIKDYRNYVLRLKFRLEGSRGWVNSGVQIHSQRSTSPPLYEMSGFQAELASPCWGCIYDESRRNKYVARSNHDLMDNVIHNGDWNDYEIRCMGKNIVILLNGVQCVDYTEPVNEYADFGKIALQIHSKGYTKISFKDIILEQY